MHLTCTIPRDWLCCADLKLSSQGSLSVGMILSGGLVWWWRSDLMVWWLSGLRMVWCGTRIWWSDLGRIWLTVVEFWSGVVIYSGGLSEENGLVGVLKFKRWEAELIVVNGSVREKRDWCTRKVGEKNLEQGSIGKNSHFFKTPITHSFLYRIPPENILQGRNCPTTCFSLKIKWFVSK